ncbi:3'-5' exonuclease [Parvularcula sp. ZS-1/3]|uniref:3'-5' exonuclease n=1 Tax=Parvularcula mediterranea TaxID=2732508 RepID=A0A7Y3RLE4_9PROT|nr:3'-5' exonuclease [Parvularcula mediterranea]NNU16259.1 3'-5' exonuclease [Parvularcula mediterranea]
MQRFVRVIDLETTGSRPPAHAVCEIGWQDVVETPKGWKIGGADGAQLCNPERPIPAMTQAVHHITDEDVVGAPVFRDIAKDILRPGEGCIALAAHRASFESRYCTPELTGGLPWICTWKTALRCFPDSPSFSNQVLKYWRKPKGLDRERALPVHRAYPDAYTTAFHLRDMLNLEGAQTLIDWTTLPGKLPRVPRGEFKGKKWGELTDLQLIPFLTDRDPDIRYSAEIESMKRDDRAPLKVRKPEQGSLL